MYVYIYNNNKYIYIYIYIYYYHYYHHHYYYYCYHYYCYYYYTDALGVFAELINYMKLVLGGVHSRATSCTASLHVKILDFRGFDSSMI